MRSHNTPGLRFTSSGLLAKKAQHVMSEELIYSITENAIALAILAFLCREIVKHWLNKDISTFKSQLQHTAELQIAEYQAQLEKEKIRLHISYGGIFEQQAEVILKLFQFISKIEKRIHFALYTTEDGNSEYQEFYSDWMEFREYYDSNKILLPESLEELFEKLLKDSMWGVRKHRSADKQLSSGKYSDKKYDRLFETQDEAQVMIAQLPIVKKELTVKLRSLIGIGEHLIENDS